MTGENENYINEYFEYAKCLFDRGLPIIYDQEGLSLLLEFDNEYLHRMSNSPKHFYRTFYILKRNGKKRRIDEPLHDLKKVQRWILNEILYKLPASKFSKAYVPNNSLKDNARFHRGTKMVLTIDLKDYFRSIKIGRVINYFKTIGYSEPISVMLANLCCYRGSLPQGAPSSPYLSNLMTAEMDEKLASFAIPRGIRYTRYADDLTFSGDFNPGEIIQKVRYHAKFHGLSINKNKIRVKKNNAQQIVTGIVVNEKMQAPRKYRNKIRQEVYYINKYGVDSHIKHINESRKNYLRHLIGKTYYVKSINGNDKKAEEYLNILKGFENN